MRCEQHTAFAFHLSRWRYAPREQHRARRLHHLLHLLDVTVARSARDPSLNVRVMRKPGIRAGGRPAASRWLAGDSTPCGPFLSPADLDRRSGGNPCTAVRLVVRL